jgi:hypothetical protein
MNYNYAEFISEYQKMYGAVDPGFLYDCIQEALGVTKPMSATYTYSDLLTVHDRAVIRKYEAHRGRKIPEGINRVIPGLAQKGLWFRASSYHFRGGWIEAASRAAVEQYPLSEILDDLVPALVNLGDVVITQNEKGTIDLSPGEHERFCDHYARFGPMGLKFRDAWEIVTWPLEHSAEVTIDPLRDVRIEMLEYFGKNLKPGKYLVRKPLSEVIPITRSTREKASVLDLDALYLGYREHGIEAAFTAVSFSLVARRLAQRVEVMSGLEEIEKAFMRSRPKLSMEVGGLSVIWAPNSLIDAAYLYLFKTSMEGGYRICADPKCGELFQGKGRQIYCSLKCQRRHRQERHRGK